jgi:hypothetical protein
MSDPVCHGGGWIVGMEERLPANPSDYYSTEGMIVGCNRIKCDRCGVMVHHFDECAARAINLSKSDYPKLYLAEDPLSFEFMYRNKDSRVYVCKCAFAKIMGGRSLDGMDQPWHCAGHPQE